jgi:hypothetical protein
MDTYLEIRKKILGANTLFEAIQQSGAGQASLFYCSLRSFYTLRILYDFQLYWCTSKNMNRFSKQYLQYQQEAQQLLFE